VNHRPLILFYGGPMDGLDETFRPMRASALAVRYGYTGTEIERHEDDGTICAFVYVWPALMDRTGP
jgi:hypothetical protein